MSNEEREAEELKVLRAAAKALAKNERLRKELRESDERVRYLCRKFDEASGSRAFAPHHLKQACAARGLI